MTSNPLIDKYNELYGKKEEPKPDYYKGEKSCAEELKELRDTSTIPVSSLKTYDTFSTGKIFLDIANKIQNGDAKVVSVSANMEHFIKSYTFEVSVYT
jgi:hypothetical protein